MNHFIPPHQMAYNMQQLRELDNIPFCNPKRQKLHAAVVAEEGLGDKAVTMLAGRTGSEDCKITTAAYCIATKTIRLNSAEDGDFHCTLDLSNLGAKEPECRSLCTRCMQDKLGFHAENCDNCGEMGGYEITPGTSLLFPNKKRDPLLFAFVELDHIIEIEASQVVGHRLLIGQQCVTFVPKAGCPWQMDDRVGMPTTVLASWVKIAEVDI